MKGPTFNSLGRCQEKMIFWENVSYDANSTFSVEPERVQIKNSRLIYLN